MSKNFFEIKNVDFNIDGKTKVKNVSFSIENEGDVICLLGPSGIGKTTIPVSYTHLTLPTTNSV